METEQCFVTLFRTFRHKVPLNLIFSMQWLNLEQQFQMWTLKITMLISCQLKLLILTQQAVPGLTNTVPSTVGFKLQAISIQWDLKCLSFHTGPICVKECLQDSTWPICLKHCNQQLIRAALISKAQTLTSLTEVKIHGSGQLKDSIVHYLTKLLKLQIVLTVATALSSTLLLIMIHLNLKPPVNILQLGLTLFLKYTTYKNHLNSCSEITLNQQL